MNERLLVVEDEETLCASLKRVLTKEGYYVETIGSAEDALNIFGEGFYDVIITDIILPGITGIELLKKIKETIPEQIVIIMTAYASLETAVEALRAGAYDYVVKPIMHEEIKQIVKNAIKQGALQDENTLLRKQIERQYDLNRIIGESPAMKIVVSDVKAIADSGSNVLLLGETGTGKEFIARVIHNSSSRVNRPFIPVNLRTIPEEMIEPGLFGYVKGAFSDASVSRRGLFEEANAGTIFIREILDMNQRIQSGLLSLLKSNEIRPVGGAQCLKADLRFIFATSMDTGAAVKEGRFSEELYKLISGSTVKIPPLRERAEDIEPLIRHMIRMLSNELCRTVRDIDSDVIETLRSYHWPGNIRELKNIVERAVLISDDGFIRATHLPQSFQRR